jgi:hypothetical protein
MARRFKECRFLGHHRLTPFTPPGSRFSHQQALQRDCDDARRQLARCAPAEVDRLHSELMAARRAAADAPLLQEQLHRQRQMWQGTEERLAKLQVCGAGAEKDRSLEGWP